MPSTGSVTHQPPAPSPARASSAPGFVSDPPPLSPLVFVGAVGGVMLWDMSIALTSYRGLVDGLLLHKYLFPTQLRGRRQDYKKDFKNDYLHVGLPDGALDFAWPTRATHLSG